MKYLRPCCQFKAHYAHTMALCSGFYASVGYSMSNKEMLIFCKILHIFGGLYHHTPVQICVGQRVLQEK